MQIVKMRAQRKFYQGVSLIMRMCGKQIWNDRSNGYLTLFYDYEGKYALPGKEEASLNGINYILDISKKYQIKSTFCTVGQLFLDYPDIIEKMIAEGHNLASHTFRHSIIRGSSRSSIEEDIRSTIEVFKQFGLNLKGIRCPQGKWNLTLLRVMSQNGLLWSAERDSAPFPYILRRKNKKIVVRFPIRMADYMFRNYDPDRLLYKLIETVENIQENRQYGAIGFHPWWMGESDARLQVMDDFFQYLKTLPSIKIVTFSEAYNLLDLPIHNQVPRVFQEKTKEVIIE